MTNKQTMYTKQLIGTVICAASLCCTIHTMKNTHPAGTLFSQKNSPCKLVEKTDEVVKVWGNLKELKYGPKVAITTLKAANVTKNFLLLAYGLKYYFENSIDTKIIFIFFGIGCSIAVTEKIFSKICRHQQEKGLRFGVFAHNQLNDLVTTLESKKSSLSINNKNIKTVKNEIGIMKKQRNRLPGISDFGFVQHYYNKKINKSMQDLLKAETGLDKLITFGQDKLLEYKYSSK